MVLRVLLKFIGYVVIQEYGSINREGFDTAGGGPQYWLLSPVPLERACPLVGVLPPHMDSAVLLSCLETDSRLTFFT